MKILYFTTSGPDYMQDSLLVGLREVLGENLTDYPKKDWIYKNTKFSIDYFGRKEFTYYKIIDDIEIDRGNIIERIGENEFDYIIFSSIHRQIKLLQDLFITIKDQKLIFLDGEDHPSIFPFNGSYWRKPKYWLLPRVHKKYLYFKREYTPETIFYRYFKLLPKSICKRIRLKNIRPISFAFPVSKIVKNIPIKQKLFPEHIVDIEVAGKLEKNSKYVFDNELDYFSDLQNSKYGITTKRAGWDCMRHYEISANGAVPCFQDLDKKPHICAPHGLDTLNCIIYKNHKDLIERINAISDSDYVILQHNAIRWAKNNSTLERANEFINAIVNHYKKIDVY